MSGCSPLTKWGRWTASPPVDRSEGPETPVRESCPLSAGDPVAGLAATTTARNCTHRARPHQPLFYRGRKLDPPPWHAPRPPPRIVRRTRTVFGASGDPLTALIVKKGARGAVWGPPSQPAWLATRPAGHVARLPSPHRPPDHLDGRGRGRSRFHPGAHGKPAPGRASGSRGHRSGPGIFRPLLALLGAPGAPGLRRAVGAAVPRTTTSPSTATRAPMPRPARDWPPRPLPPLCRHRRPGPC